MPPRTHFLSFALFAALVLPAAAQAPPAGPPINVRGTVGAFDGHTLKVAARDGQQLTVVLAPDFKVRALARMSLADIKAGDLVASTSVKGSDGKLHALEVHVLPKTVRKFSREGQFPWDLQPGSVMTNATAAGVAAAPQGQVLHVTWTNGAADVVVAPDTPIVGYVDGDPSLLKPGAAIMIFAAKKGPDGNLTAAAVTAEKDGVKPPM